MNHSFERRIRNHGVVESIGLRDIWNNGEVESVRSIAGMRLSNALSLASAADSRDYRVTSRIQLKGLPQTEKKGIPGKIQANW